MWAGGDTRPYVRRGGPGSSGLERHLEPFSLIIPAEACMKLLVFFMLFVLGLALEAQTSPAPTVAQAEEFMNKAEARLAELSIKVNQATWVHDNFITEDTEALAADANDENTAVTTELVSKPNGSHGCQCLPELRATS